MKNNFSQGFGAGQGLHQDCLFFNSKTFEPAAGVG
jgi:hypothetical protein